jgi:hypothetical protein
MKFKIFNLMLFLSLLWQEKLSGQCYWNDNKGIKTPLGTTIQRFNWRADDYYVYTKSNQTIGTQIKSPFTGLSNANDNIKGFIDQNVKDNDPDQGWELLTKQFGSSGDPYLFPTLVLYNRHIGIIRTFVYVPDIPNFSKNTGRIEIRFSYPTSVKKESALLSPLQNPQSALDHFVKKVASNTLQRASYFGGLFWMYADFPVAYDPCSCRHFTEIDIKPQFINIEQVNLVTATQSSAAMSGGSPASAFTGISQPFNYFGKGIEAGTKKGANIGLSVGYISNLLNTYVLPNFDTKRTVQTIGPDDTNPRDITIGSNFRIPDFIKTNFGAAGTFLGLVEYFVSGGSTTAMASPAVNYSITGTITDSIIGQNTQIYVPGSPWDDNTLNGGAGSAIKSQPVYNNSLGVFALMETPKSVGSYDNPFLSLNSVNQPSVFKLKLDKNFIEDLKYVVNPSSNLVVDNISTALVVTTTFEQVKTKFNQPSEPMSSGSVNISEHKPIPNPEQFQRKRIFTCSSPTMSFDCLKDYVISISLNDATLTEFLSKIQLNVTLKDVTTGKLYYHVAQYLLRPTNVSNNSITINDFSNIPLNLNVSDLTLTSNLTLKAWQNIRLSGNINTNGFKLNLISGGKVDIGNIALSPAISIDIKTPADCGDRTPQPMAGNLVQSFCNNSTKYNPIVPTSARNEDEEASSLKSQTTTTTSLSISPNPFNNQLSIQYELQEATQVTVSLSNALGQVVKVLVNEKVEAGSYQINESTADLPSGVYIVSMKTPNGLKTQKVVKQNN